MKKRIVSLLLLALMVTTLLVTPIFASLNWNVVDYCRITLSFSGTTARCRLDVYASDSDADITATIKLQKKGLLGIYSTKEKWEDVTATGTLNFYDTYSPVDSGEYRLTADIDVVGSGGSDSFTQTTESEK